MVKILFGLFIGNNNGELRRTTIILSPPRNRGMFGWHENSRIAVVLRI
jgi:hypothetical protein